MIFTHTRPSWNRCAGHRSRCPRVCTAPAQTRGPNWRWHAPPAVVPPPADVQIHACALHFLSHAHACTHAQEHNAHTLTMAAFCSPAMSPFLKGRKDSRTPSRTLLFNSSFCCVVCAACTVSLRKSRSAPSCCTILCIPSRAPICDCWSQSVHCCTLLKTALSSGA